MSRAAPFGPEKCKKFVDLGGDAKGLVPSAHGFEFKVGLGSDTRDIVGLGMMHGT